MGHFPGSCPFLHDLHNLHLPGFLGRTGHFSRLVHFLHMRGCSSGGQCRGATPGATTHSFCAAIRTASFKSPSIHRQCPSLCMITEFGSAKSCACSFALPQPTRFLLRITIILVDGSSRPYSQPQELHETHSIPPSPRVSSGSAPGFCGPETSHEACASPRVPCLQEGHKSSSLNRLFAPSLSQLPSFVSSAITIAV